MFKMLLVQRLVFGLAGLILPDQNALALRIRHTVTAMLFAVMGGIMFSAAALAGLGTMYYYFVEQGADPYVTAAGIALVTVLLAVVSILRAYHAIGNVTQLKMGNGLLDGGFLTKKSASEPQGMVSALASAFMEGLMDKSETHATPAPHMKRRKRYGHVNHHQVQPQPYVKNSANESPADSGLITRETEYPSSQATH
ncbi:MAG: hypothetical protein K2Q12_03835 [Rickettsiales bacterium]|nr:hypothetical protein [Rickettsiales bacterium]